MRNIKKYVKVNLPRWLCKLVEIRMPKVVRELGTKMKQNTSESKNFEKGIGLMAGFFDIFSTIKLILGSSKEKIFA